MDLIKMVEGVEIITFDLTSTPIQDLDHFCKILFTDYNSTFEIFGIPRVSSNGKGKIVQAVDLTNGIKLYFEIYSDIVCIYLSKHEENFDELYQEIKMKFTKVLTEFFST